MNPPAPRDWSARDFALDEAAAVLDDAEDDLHIEREVHQTLGEVLYHAAERGEPPDLRGLLVPEEEEDDDDDDDLDDIEGGDGRGGRRVQMAKRVLAVLRRNGFA